MNIKRYLTDITKDFLIVCGGLTVIAAILLGGEFIKSLNSSLFCQVMLLSAAFTFFKYAFFNKYDLGKNKQAINFAVFSLLADTMIILWLFFFSTNKLTDSTLIIIYLIINVVVKLAVYAMMYSDGKKEAAQINQKLNEYANKK